MLAISAPAPSPRAREEEDVLHASVWVCRQTGGPGNRRARRSSVQALSGSGGFSQPDAAFQTPLPV